jgi:uncharacterized protein YbjT (DUF2867 family)
MNPLQDKLVCVFGGGGFVGRYAVQALCAAGARVRVAVRRPELAGHVKPLGNLGQVQVVAADVRNMASVSAAVAGADVVVNLVGSFDDVDAVQHIGAANVAVAAKAAGAGALLHMSAIGADAASASRYGRSKAAGEAAVLAAFPSAVILRPSIIFGREDAFINRFAALIRMLPVVPVIGAETRFQPVFVGDVARTIVAALVGRASGVLELGGPRVLSMLELNQWIGHATGRDKAFVPVPAPLAKLMAAATGWLPGAPITMDQFLMLGSDNVVRGKDGLAALGVVPTPMEAVAQGWLDTYRKHGRFGVSGAAA